MVSREAAFLYNNLVLVGIAFSVLWGTLFPIISEAVRGAKITVGPPFFNTVNVPLGLAAARAHRHRSAHRVAQGVGVESASVSSRRRSPAGSSLGVAAVRARHARRVRARRVHARRLRRRRRSCRSSTRAFGARRSNARRGDPRGVRPPRRAQPAALRRLHRARGHRRCCSPRSPAWRSRRSTTSRCTPGEAYELADPSATVDVRRARASRRRSAQPRRDRGRARGVARRQARRGSSRARSGSTSTAASKPPFEPSTEVGIQTSAKHGHVRRARRRRGDGDAPRCASPSIRSCVWVWIGGFIMVIGGLIVMWPQAERRRAPSGYVVDAASRPRRASSARQP